MILKEQHFEDILCKYPELIEDGLIFLKRQVKVHNKRIDILFEDKFKRNLLVELKNGVIKDDHIGQLLGYEGFLLSADDPTIRIMLIGNRVPPNLQSSLDHHGIAWREFGYSMLKNFLEAKRDFDLLKYFEDYELPDVKKDMKVIETANMVEKTKLISLSIEQKVDQMKSCEAYIKFRNVINKKETNENEAKKILQNNFGNLTINHLKEIFELIDEPYTPWNDASPWFGRLLKPNANNLVNEREEKRNNWISYLLNQKLPIEKRIDALSSPTFHLYVKGASVGLITLFLYLFDKTQYSIWWETHHYGLGIFYKSLEKYKKSGSLYVQFNQLSKEFARKYGFNHTELDWIFSYAPKLFQ